MRKMAKLFCLIMILTIVVPAAMTLAATYLPQGATIAAAVSGDTATITVTGISGASLERYYWDRIDRASGMTINLNQGRRFQVMSGGQYLLITPEMASGGPYKLVGVGIDCSNEKGCCLIVK